jgi:hypothetical protein
MHKGEYILAYYAYLEMPHLVKGVPTSWSFANDDPKRTSILLIFLTK